MRSLTETRGSARIAACGVLTALALIFSYIEFLVPLPIAIPGIKLGLANIVCLVCLYALGEKHAFLINVTRIALAALLFGSVFSALYALAGGVVSFAVMALRRVHGGRRVPQSGATRCRGAARGIRAGLLLFPRTAAVGHGHRHRHRYFSDAHPAEHRKGCIALICLRGPVATPQT